MYFLSVSYLMPFFMNNTKHVVFLFHQKCSLMHADIVPKSHRGRREQRRTLLAAEVLVYIEQDVAVSFTTVSEDSGLVYTADPAVVPAPAAPLSEL